MIRLQRHLRLPAAVAIMLVVSSLGWALWPRSQEPELPPDEQSRKDGRCRFYVADGRPSPPANQTLLQRLSWRWREFKNRRRPKPVYTYPPLAARELRIVDGLKQCAAVADTRYLIAVEIVGKVEFRTTNALTGPQWAVAFVQAVESSRMVHCYDFGQKLGFADDLVFIRERPGEVKIVPRSKLANYKAAGLIKAIPESIR